MAAGLGFKTFTTGEVLTAADVNGYLMQGILVFATEAARNSAITSPQEGQFAFTKDNNSLWYYTGSAWVASGATGDIEGVTAGVGISGGGTSGTVTITNSMATAIDAKGDLVPGTGADTFSRLAVGANGTVLTADSAEATGLKWATASSGALVHLNTTGYSSSSGFNVDDVFSATYDNYVIYIINSGSANGDVRMQFRVSGSTDTSSNYNTQTLNADNTTVSGTRETAQTSTIVGKTNTVYTISKIDLQQPFASLPTGHTTQCQNNIQGAPEMRHHFGNFQNSTSFTGFRLTPSTGTFGGTLYLFGVKQ